MHRPALARLLPIPAALALLLTGCGSADEDATGADSGPAVTSPTAEATASPVPSPEDSPSPTATEDETAETVEVTVVGQDISFDNEQITVPVGAEVTMTFENRDEGIPHNLHVVGLDEQTEVAQGPETQTLTFTPTEPGTYRFQCDVHPAQMEGELVVQ